MCACVRPAVGRLSKDKETVKEGLSTQPGEGYLTQWNSFEQIKGLEDGLGLQIVSWLKLVTMHIFFFTENRGLHHAEVSGMIRGVFIPGLQAPGNSLSPKTVPCVPEPRISPTSPAGRLELPTRPVRPQTIHLLLGTVYSLLPG